jgi:acyl CoA:acetate/3-ketoacid CoA transferase alpha subunit
MSTREVGGAKRDHVALDILGMFEAPDVYRENKVRPVEDALRTYVRPGMMLHFGYNQARAMALSNALVRAFGGTKPGFTIVSAGLVANQAAMFSAGIVKKLIVSFVGENYPAPSPNRIMQEAISSGSVEIENQSLLVIAQRLAAGAFGFPFALTRSIQGSSLAENSSFKTIDDPFGSGTTVGAASALIPDITFIHALAADPQGNLLLAQPFGEGEVAAFAASRGVIATAEKIVSPNVIRQFAHLTKVPAHRVLSVSEEPLGCHPYGLYSPPGLDVAGYVEDYDFFKDLQTAAKLPATFDSWAKEWVVDIDGNHHYLAKLGAGRIEALRAAAVVGAWENELDETVVRAARQSGHDSIDEMIVAAAGVIEHKIKERNYAIIASGVGYANLAAWLAVSNLQRRDAIAAELVAEIGLYGFFPKPGEPFIFSNRNIPTCKGLTTAESILGLYVSGRHNKCLAVIGAAQIDPTGNINSTYTGDGKFLVGSGGANDIASAAAEVVVISQQSKRRLVNTLPYVTSIGRQVSTLITDLGIYSKRDGQFMLTGYFAAAGQDAQKVIERIRATCEWPLTIADGLACIQPPNAESLFRIRMYDRRREFLTSAR